jgi:hypothetical protein
MSETSAEDMVEDWGRAPFDIPVDLRLVHLNAP